MRGSSAPFQAEKGADVQSCPHNGPLSLVYPHFSPSPGLCFPFGNAPIYTRVKGCFLYTHTIRTQADTFSLTDVHNAGCDAR